MVKCAHKNNICRLSHYSCTLFTTRPVFLDPLSVLMTFLMVRDQGLVRAEILAFRLTDTVHNSSVGIGSLLSLLRVSIRIASVPTSTVLLLSCRCSWWCKVAQEALENLTALHGAGPASGGLWADMTQPPSRL